MAHKSKSTGSCRFCNRKLTKSGMARHLDACEKRMEAIEAAVAKSRKEEILYHLQIQDLWSGAYWMHLEMSGKGSLEELDNYLRHIWLECCGHLSQFSIGRWGDQVSMDLKAGQVFRKGLEIIHVYDFGTSSETKLKVISARKGRPLTPNPIMLMARNDPPEAHCIECGKPASWLCTECVYEYDEDGTLCDECAEDHPHDDYGGVMPLVNSPRVGMCGYTGPAEPPY